MSTEELLKQLEDDRDAYLATFQKVHEALAKSISTATKPSPLPSSPKARPVSDRPTRLSLGESDRPPLLGVSGPSTFKSSFISGETDDLSDDDEALYVQDPLPTTSLDDEHLRSHLKNYKWSCYAKQMLTPLWAETGRLLSPSLFPTGADPNGDQSRYSLYQAFDVGTDGAPLPLQPEKSEPRVPKGQIMWQIMKDINVDPSKRQAVGRITILREPSPTLFSAVHLTMSKIFDMDEIFDNLVLQGETTAYMTRAFSEDPRKQKCFMFSFEYFTIIGDECEPMSWQESDHERNRNPNHIPISRCSSVVALSLVGEPFRKLRNSARRAKTKHGFVYSPWSPWHVLNIQCYPDWKSNTDGHESSNHYVNGPEAFLTTLLTEYRDAQKRLEEISQRIQKLITPPAEFMFNGELRDKLLFEDSDFTYSRRYFWAFQTLGSMNHSIKCMVDSYEDTFTANVWDGTHKTLWPLVEDTPRNSYWKKRMVSLKKDFEFEINALKVIMDENDDRRKEIRNLRDNLFSGTSVLESRKSVEQSEITVQQGHNIKLLTLVNMFFLPLTFVTSVFGMTNMPPEPASFWRFGVVMATVCIPFFLLIGSMNTSAGMRFWKDRFGRFFYYICSCFSWPLKNSDISVHRNESIMSDSSQTPEMHHRSLSATEGIAERMGQMERIASVEREQDGDVSPSLKRAISFGQALRHTPLEPSTPPDTNREKGHMRPSSTFQLSSPLSVTAPEPAIIAISNLDPSVISNAVEVPDTNNTRAALQENGLGIWDKLLTSGRRNGGQDHNV